MNPEYSILKQRIARRLRHEGETDESVKKLSLSECGLAAWAHCICWLHGCLSSTPPPLPSPSPPTAPSPPHPRPAPRSRHHQGGRAHHFRRPGEAPPGFHSRVRSLRGATSAGAAGNNLVKHELPPPPSCRSSSSPSPWTPPRPTTQVRRVCGTGVRVWHCRPSSSGTPALQVERFTQLVWQLLRQDWRALAQPEWPRPQRAGTCACFAAPCPLTTRPPRCTPPLCPLQRLPACNFTTVRTASSLHAAPRCAFTSCPVPLPPLPPGAVITGVQIHNWAHSFEDDSPNMEYVVSRPTNENNRVRAQPPTAAWAQRSGNESIDDNWTKQPIGHPAWRTRRALFVWLRMHTQREQQQHCSSSTAAAAAAAAALRQPCAPTDPLRPRRPPPRPAVSAGPHQHVRGGQRREDAPGPAAGPSTDPPPGALPSINPILTITTMGDPRASPVCLPASTLGHRRGPRPLPPAPPQPRPPGLQPTLPLPPPPARRPPADPPAARRRPQRGVQHRRGHGASRGGCPLYLRQQGHSAGPEAPPGAVSPAGGVAAVGGWVWAGEWRIEGGGGDSGCAPLLHCL